MYNNLILYRNELKNKLIPKYKLIGIVSSLLLSKEIFQKNTDIDVFVKEVFSIELKPYLLKSRTLTVTKISKLIFSIEDDRSYKNKLYSFVQKCIDSMVDLDKKKKNQLDRWFNQWNTI